MKLVEGHQQRQRAQRDYQGMVCVICKQVGNSVQLIDHVASVLVSLSSSMLSF